MDMVNQKNETPVCEFESQTTHNPVIQNLNTKVSSSDVNPSGANVGDEQGKMRVEAEVGKPRDSDSVFHYMYRTNLFLLFLCFALVMTSSTLLISVVPLAAEEIDISGEFATLTIGMYLFGAAVSASLSGMLFSKYGRFIG